jgi:hypothetical protein
MPVAQHARGKGFRVNHSTLDGSPGCSGRPRRWPWRRTPHTARLDSALLFVLVAALALRERRAPIKGAEKHRRTHRLATAATHGERTWKQVSGMDHWAPGEVPGAGAYTDALARAERQTAGKMAGGDTVLGLRMPSTSVGSQAGAGLAAVRVLLDAVRALRMAFDRRTSASWGRRWKHWGLAAACHVRA